MLLVLVGLLAVLAALWWTPGPAPGPAPALDTDPAPVQAHPLRPGELQGEVAPVAEEAPSWRREGVVLPPDSPFHAVGPPPGKGLIRGRVAPPTWGTWPRRIDVFLERQDDGVEVGRWQPTSAEPDFRFEDVPYGHYRLRMEAGDFEPVRMLLTLSPASPDLYVPLPLRPAARVAGRVLRRDGAPVEGLTVTVIPKRATPEMPAVPSTGVTDELGRFVVSGLPPGAFLVHPGPPHHPVGPARELRLGTGEEWVELRVPRLGAAVVELEDLDHGGFAGLRVQALRVGHGAADPGYSVSLPADEDGSVEFRHLPPGEYAFTAYGGAFQRVIRRGRVPPDGTVRVHVPVRRRDQRGR